MIRMFFLFLLENIQNVFFVFFIFLCHLFFLYISSIVLFASSIFNFPFSIFNFPRGPYRICEHYLLVPSSAFAVLFLSSLVSSGSLLSLLPLHIRPWGGGECGVVLWVLWFRAPPFLNQRILTILGLLASFLIFVPRPF